MDTQVEEEHAWLPRMLSVVERPRDNITTNVAQMELHLLPVEAEEGSWLVPVSLSVTSYSALFPRMLSVPSRAVALAQPHTSIDTRLEAIASDANAQGYVGAVDFSSSPTSVVGTLSMQVDVADSSIWKTVDDLSVAAMHSDYFFSAMSVSAQHDVEWTCARLALLVDNNTMLSNPSLRLFASATHLFSSVTPSNDTDTGGDDGGN